MEKDPKPKSRVIFINDINEKRGRGVIEKLFELHEENPEKDILLVVSSYGGDIYEFMGIHDAIKLITCDVAVLAIGKAMSSGLLLLMSGTRGKRFVTQNTTLLTHEMGVEVEGQLTDVKTELAENERLQKLIRDMLTEYTKVRDEDVKKWLGRDTYLSAAKVVKLGIADHIVKSPAFWKKLNL